MKLIQFIVFSLFISFFIGGVSANPDWTISGNTVFVDTSNAYISVTPHTLYNSGYIYLNITSKSYSGNVDLAFLFDENSGVKPLSGERKNGGGEYVSIVSLFSKNSINYDGFDTAYLGNNLPVTSGTTYQLRVWVDIPAKRINTKYGVALKPSSKTISESISQGYFYYLDPWVNTTGGDHDGEDWIVDNGDTIGGVHYNIKNFTISSGYTVSVTTGSPLNVSAQKIEIAGTLNGNSKGYAGGGPNAAGAGTGGGGKGLTNTIGAGGGGYGGVGGTGESQSTPYGIAGVVYGYLSGHTIQMGSGGGGGGSGGGDGGCTGGYGGGSITLYANYINVSGTITTNGGDGQSCVSGAGGGSGGGILINGQYVNVSGNITSRGGVGDTSADKDSGGGGGGRVKIFYLKYSLTGAINVSGGAGGSVGGGPGAVGTIYTLYDTANMTINAPYGYLYELDGITPVSNANITFSNATWSQEITTNALGFWNATGISTTEIFDYTITKQYRPNDYGIVFINSNASNNTVLVFSYDAPTLISPANESTISTTFPPLTYDVTFTWQDTGALYSRIVVAEDEAFNVITSDTTVAASTSTQSLIVNDVYYWKVYDYDGSVYSNASEIFNVNLTGTSSATGSSIEGVVYHNGDGYVPIHGAEVSIWNATWSNSATTGSNGYYVFSGLTDGEVYSLQARADRYYTSSTAIVSAGATPTTRNFYLLEDLTDTEWWHYVKFTTQSIWGTKYQNVDTTVYLGDSVTSYLTGTTGSDGSVTFHLNQHVQYRITFINATQGISETRTIYPKDNHYIIIISETFTGWDTYTVPISDAIDFTITKSEINATHAYINFTYSDTLSQTTALKVYINQTNGSDYINQTAIDSYSGAGNTTHSFIIQNYVGQSYIVHLVATHTTYGTIDTMYSVSFKGEIADKFPGIPPSVWLYASIFILIFTGGIFVNSNVEKGMLITCIMFFVLYGLGGFGSLPSAVQTSMLAGGILGFILSIVANLNKSNKEEGYS